MEQRTVRIGVVNAGLVISVGSRRLLAGTPPGWGWNTALAMSAEGRGLSMSRAEMAGSPSMRALCAVVAGSLVLLVAAWGVAIRPSTAVAATQPARCKAPGQTYKVNVIVEHGGGKVEMVALFLVCKPDHFVKIVDSDGRSYDDLDDFRAHNELFSGDDKISVPRVFPSVDATAPSGFAPAVSGHTGTTSVWWWVLGGFAFVAIIIGVGIAWLAARRRHGWA